MKYALYAAAFAFAIGFTQTTVIALLFPVAANAAKCEAPMNHLDAYQADADALSMPLSIRMEADHPGFAAVYSSALGLSIPADSQMVGIFFVEGPDAVFVGLIEVGGCVRYTIIIPRQAHDFAMASAAAGA